MRFDPDRGPDRHRAAARWAWLLAGCALMASDAGAQVQVTSQSGAVRLAGGPLALHAEVSEGKPLEVGTDGRCTLLMDDRALVRLCGGARATFEAVGSPGTIDLREGALTLVALDRPVDGPLVVYTPAARIDVLGAGAQISVEPGNGTTVVSALESPVRVSRADGSQAPIAGTLMVEAGQQLTLRPGEAPGAPHPVSRESLAACLGDGSEFGAALRAERAILAAALPAVSAGDARPGDRPVSDLRKIVRADFPTEGLPLEAPSAPSALVIELSKLGMDEEVCDPITCNPVYKVAPPGPCGVPPERGCIP